MIECSLPGDGLFCGFKGMGDAGGSRFEAGPVLAEQPDSTSNQRRLIDDEEDDDDDKDDDRRAAAYLEKLAALREQEEDEKGHSDSVGNEHAAGSSSQSRLDEYRTALLDDLERRVRSRATRLPYQTYSHHHHNDLTNFPLIATNLSAHAVAAAAAAGIKPFNCDLCGYSCKKLGNLKRHVRTHTGEKPYVCDRCDFTCARLSHLQDHMWAHTGRKPYSCELCDYAGDSVFNLKKHMKTHTGDKPFTANT